jgi:copper oxidase (laccase) domain-containing protein
MTGPPGTAFVGPSIGPCCFTVGEEVAEAFARRYGAEVVGEGPRVDLWRAVERALAEVEVPVGRVVNPRLCTVCNHDLFFSHRADGPSTGRHGAVAWVVESTPGTVLRQPGG